MNEIKINVTTFDGGYAHYDMSGNIVRAAYIINTDGHELFSEMKQIGESKVTVTRRTFADMIETIMETYVKGTRATTTTTERLDKNGHPISFTSVALFENDSSPNVEKESTDYDIKYEKLEKGYRKRFISKYKTLLNPNIYGFEVRNNGRIEINYRASELILPNGIKVRQLVGWILEREDKSGLIVKRQEFISNPYENGFTLSIDDIIKRKAGIITCEEKLEYDENKKLVKLTRSGLSYPNDEIEYYTHISNE